MPFKPGQSGNPRGRPRKADALATLFDEHFKKEDRIGVIAKAVEQALAGNKDARDFLFDRTYGKPMQAIEMTGTDGGPLEVEYSSIDLAIAHQRIADHQKAIDQRQQNEASSDE